MTVIDTDATQAQSRMSDEKHFVIQQAIDSRINRRRGAAAAAAAAAAAGERRMHTRGSTVHWITVHLPNHTTFISHTGLANRHGGLWRVHLGVDQQISKQSVKIGKQSTQTGGPFFRCPAFASLLVGLQNLSHMVSAKLRCNQPIVSTVAIIYTGDLDTLVGRDPRRVGVLIPSFGALFG
jgi:hypothetical protein